MILGIQFVFLAEYVKINTIAGKYNTDVKYNNNRGKMYYSNEK